MKEIIGMRALSMLLAALLVSGTMVPAVSAENESRAGSIRSTSGLSREICRSILRSLKPPRRGFRLLRRSHSSTPGGDHSGSEEGIGIPDDRCGRGSNLTW